MKHTAADIVSKYLEDTYAAQLGSGFMFTVNADMSEPEQTVNVSDDPTSTLKNQKDLRSNGIHEFPGIQISVRSDKQGSVSTAGNKLMMGVDSLPSPESPAIVELIDADEEVCSYKLINISRISGVAVTKNEKTGRWLYIFLCRVSIISQ